MNKTEWKGGTGGEENPQVCLPVWVRKVTGVWGAEGTEQGSLSPPRKKHIHTTYSGATIPSPVSG